MSKKRSRQPDPNGDMIQDSTDNESGDESNSTGRTCLHIVKAVNFNKLKKYINKNGIKNECSVCKKNKANASRIDEQESPLSSTISICLQCGHEGCGDMEQGHALEHCKKQYSDCHFMAVDTQSWSVWCSKCELKINIGCKNKLQETVEFVKKAATVVRNLPQANITVTECQEETVNINIQKEKVLHNLPKVGGLMNLGNTCFFNAVLQCLAQTPFLVKVLDDLRLPGQKFVLPGGEHKLANSSEEIELPPIEGTLEGWGHFTSILHKTLVEMQNSDGHQCYRPSELLNSFKKKTIQCMDGGQHDSHELLRHLLEIVRNEDLRRYQSIILKELGLNEKTNPDEVEESLKSRVKFYGNQASARLLGPELVFHGVLVSTLECLDCHHFSQNTEPFLDLSLPVMADKPQPPILKKQQNSGLGYIFNLMAKINADTPPEHQSDTELKIVRKRERQVRRDRRGDNTVWTFNKNNIAEENNGSILKSEESDADVEDNIEIEPLLPEIGESGYSSKKQSALPSPASPSTDPIKPHEPMNEMVLDNYLQLSPIDNVDTNTLPSPSSADTSAQNTSDTRVADRLENSESPENDTETQQTRFMLSTPSVVNSNLTSPEGQSITLTSIASKESPINSVSSLTNGENLEKVENSTIRVNSVVSTAHNEQEDTWNHGLSTINLNDERIRRLANGSNEEWNQCNGINGITSSISKMGLGSNSQSSPTRYATKEGECSIQSCLNQFTALELMSNSNKVGCEACTAREKKLGKTTKMVCTPSTKQYLIFRVPAVLILHLKRFQTQRVNFRKVSRHVPFPMVFDLAPICKNHKKPAMYALYGVVEHSGTIHGGHYVAYVKSRVPIAPNDPRWSFLPSKDVKDEEENSSSSSADSETEETAANFSSTVEPPPGKWYYVSDSRVLEVDESTVLQSQAYLLFYERIL